MVILFHHARGLTEGVEAFADELRAAGHTVQTPDLYEGRTFPSLNAGVAFAQETGFGTIIERGAGAAEGAGGTLIGISLGALPAQALAHQARRVVLISGAIPLQEFGGSWPDGVPLQLHLPDPDDDVEIARDLAATIPGAELFEYPGADHLFLDRSLPGYDEQAAALLTRRVLDFLA